MTIRQWVPAAQCEPTEDALVFRGEAQTRGRAIAALRELDYPLKRIRVSRRQLAEAPVSACAYPEYAAAWSCPKNDCGGFLHLTGLRAGDQVMTYPNREHPHAPFWAVYRGDERLNIFVDFE